MQETMADTSLINIGEDIMREAMVTHTKEAAEVISEEEDTLACEVALTYQTIVNSEGSLHKGVACSLQNAKNKKKQKLSTCLTVLSSDSKVNIKRMVVLHISWIKSGR